MAQVTELGYLTLGVSDLDAWKTFASPGPRPRSGRTQDAAKLLPADGLLASPDHPDRGRRGRPAGSGLRVAGQDEFRDLAARLEAAGVAVRIGSQAEAEDAPRARGHVPDRPERLRRRDLPRTARAVRQALPPRPAHAWPLQDRRRRPGPHDAVADRRRLEKTYAFYRLLGMRGGIEYKLPMPGLPRPVPLMFLHCNERQHTFAFAGPGEKRINHIMIEVENIGGRGPCPRPGARSPACRSSSSRAATPTTRCSRSTSRTRRAS